jgi:hypothetical protein
MKLYVLTKDLDIGYIAHLCTCDECSKRRDAELTINYLDGLFMSQTTIKGILSKNDVIATSNNLDELKEMKLTMQFSDGYLCRYLEAELLKND